MTPNSYEELEARLRERHAFWNRHKPLVPTLYSEALDALSALRKRLDEADAECARLRHVGVIGAAAVAEMAESQLATLRAENERLTREFDKGFSRLMRERNEAQAEAERLRKVADERTDILRDLFAPEHVDGCLFKADSRMPCQCGFHDRRKRFFAAKKAAEEIVAALTPNLSSKED